MFFKGYFVNSRGVLGVGMVDFLLDFIYMIVEVVCCIWDYVFVGFEKFRWNNGDMI